MTTQPYEPVKFADLPAHMQEEIRQGKGFADRSPVEWRAMADEMTGDPEMQRAVQDGLDGQIIHFTRLRAYMNAREVGQPHHKAVDISNVAVAKVRRLLGYSYAQDPKFY